MTRFKRLRAVWHLLKFVWLVAKSFVTIQAKSDEIDALAQEMASCEACEAGVPCETHRDEFTTLAEDINDHDAN